MYKKKKNTLNTNITVEKIDTTETLTKKTQKIKKNINKSNNKLSETKLTQKKDQNENKDKKNKTRQKINNHLDSLDELSLVLSNISENYDPSNLDTDTLLKRTQMKKEKKKKQKIVLQFNKTKNIDHIRYSIINNYIKKNINTIKDILYNKNLIKNKDIPYRILFHIYVNYLNDDMKIIFE
jgi:hypothetical protein